MGVVTASKEAIVKTILLDMDGVLVDFMGGLHHALNLPWDPDNYRYKAGEYDCFESMVESNPDKLKSMGPIYRTTDERAFWANLEWDRFGKKYLAVAQSFKVPIYICTKPMLRPEAWAGKIDWLGKHIKDAVSGTIITSGPKHMLAKPGAVLIDDKDENVNEFRAAGGQAYLIPQPWNSAHGIAGSDITSDLHMRLETYLR